MAECNIRLKPKVKATERYRKYLQIASLFLKKPLTPVQMDILDELYNMDGVLTTESRKHIREALGKTADLLNNYILAMRKDGIIIGDKINPQLLQPIPPGEVFSIAVDMQIIL